MLRECVCWVKIASNGCLNEFMYTAIAFYSGQLRAKRIILRAAASSRVMPCVCQWGVSSGAVRKCHARF